MEIFLSAGEPSGDLYGGALADALRKRAPDVELWGMGGPAMARAGVALTVDIGDSSVMGLVEVLGAVPRLLRTRSCLFGEVRRRRPAVVVLIDFPGFHMGLARRVHRLGIPVVYFIPPKAWAWRPRRARRVAQTTHRVLCILPFAAEFYAAAGASVEYVGHPLLDLYRQTPPPSREEARRQLGIAEECPVLGLLPGSRRKEVAALLPPMLEAAALVAERLPALQCVLPLAATLSEAVLKPLEAHPVRERVRVVREGTPIAVRASDALLAKSGTVTLEAALLGVPMVIAYKMAPLTFQIVRRLVRVPYSGLPNLILGRSVAPELYQREVSGRRLAEAVWPLLTDPQAAERQRRAWAEVVQRLGDGKALDRAAAAILRVAEEGGAG